MLRANAQSGGRGRAKTPKAGRQATTHVATATRQVWCWDMTCLPVAVTGCWFYRYLIQVVGVNYLGRRVASRAV